MKLGQIENITVIGLGRMGHGIAQTFAMAGFQVRCYDELSKSRNSTLNRIRRNLEKFVSNKLLSADAINPVLSRIEIMESEFDAVEGAQFVVEAIVEDRIAKQELLARIEGAVSDEAIIASNSSTFPISETGRQLRLPNRAIVTHWFNPPHIVPTVEVVPSSSTSKVVAEVTIALHKKIGKQAILLNVEIPGFLVNRVQAAMYREVWDLYERGIASAEDIDSAIQGSFGFRLAANGPLTICDFGGIDIWSTVYKGLAPEIRGDTKIPTAIQKLLYAGRLGVRVGAGFHDYHSEPVEDLSSQRDDLLLKLGKLLRSETD